MIAVPKTNLFSSPFQNQEMLTEGDLTSSMDQSEKVREMQDKIASLRAQVINSIVAY